MEGSIRYYFKTNMAALRHTGLPTVGVCGRRFAERLHIAVAALARRALSPEEQLAFAVLTSGIEDACGAPGGSGGKRGRCRAEAVKWMESE